MWKLCSSDKWGVDLCVIEGVVDNDGTKCDITEYNVVLNQRSNNP